MRGCTMERFITQDERQLGRIDAAIAFNKKAIDEALETAAGSGVTRPKAGDCWRASSSAAPGLLH